MEICLLLFRNDLIKALKECRRDFFKIEHPSLEKSISTSKSTKISIFQKLQQATQIISEINQGTYQPPTKHLPTYVQLKKIKDKSYLILIKEKVLEDLIQKWFYQRLTS